MKPFEIVACLNRLFSEFDRLADDVGGEKIKTIGDAYMVASGCPCRARPREGRDRARLEFAAAAPPPEDSARRCRFRSASVSIPGRS